MRQETSGLYVVQCETQWVVVNAKTVAGLRALAEGKVFEGGGRGRGGSPDRMHIPKMHRQVSTKPEVESNYRRAARGCNCTAKEGK